MTFDLANEIARANAALGYTKPESEPPTRADLLAVVVLHLAEKREQEKTGKS